MHARNAGDGLILVKFVAKMDVNVFRGRIGICYKYVVFSRRMEEVGHPFEYLYGAPYGDQFTNRMLKVPPNMCTPQGTIYTCITFLVAFDQHSIFSTAVIRQHDTMIFPEAKDKDNIFVRGFTSLVGYFTGSSSGSDHPKFKVPRPDKMRSMCLEIYLNPSKKRLLSGSFKAKWDISKAVEGFVSLFQSCYCQYYGASEISCQEWKISGIRNVRWLLHA